FDETRPTGDLEFYRESQVELTETALFGEVGYAFTNRWRGSIGGRWFDYDFDQSVGVMLPIWDPDLYTEAVAVSDDGFLAKINTSYDFSKDVMGYVTLSEGYRMGGANSVPLCSVVGQGACGSPDEILIKPDTTTNFEVGVRTAWNGGSLIFNAALYRIDWDGMQTLGEPQEGATPITGNAGEARSQGVELSLQSRGGRWSFFGACAYNDAKLTKDSIGLVDGVFDGFDGDRLSGTPEHQGSFHAAYSRPLSNGWNLDVGYG